MAEYWFSQFNPAIFLSVSGEDAQGFLQSQCSQNIRKLDPGTMSYTLWLNRKGKILAGAWVLCESENLYYIYNAEGNSGALVEHMESYIIADDVMLEDLGARYAGFLMSRVVAEECGLDIPPSAGNRWTRIESDGIWVVASGRAETGACELLVEKASVASFVEKLKGVPGVTSVEEDWVKVESLKQGLVAIPGDMGDGDLPQEGPLEHAISYNKGCYLGQEVMARIHSMGTPRRSMRGLGFLDEVASGMELFHQGRKVGEVRSAVRDGELWLAWVMIQKSFQMGEVLTNNAGKELVYKEMEDDDGC